MFESEWYWDNVDAKALLIKLGLIRRDSGRAVQVGEASETYVGEAS